MLVLSRHKEQSVMIGDEIEVRVVDIRGDKVRLGINAPRNVNVHRREVYDSIRDENRSAAAIAPQDVSAVAPRPSPAGPPPVTSKSPPAAPEAQPQPAPLSAPQPAFPPVRMAVLISGGGTTLKNLIDHIAAGALPATIATVICSRPDAAGIAHATNAGIRVEVVDRKRFGDDVAAFSRAVFEKVGRDVDLVCLAGWLCLLEYPPAFAGRIMNIHPALLPSFGGRGMYGQRVHEAVLASGCKVSGCTVHFVDETYDTGPIILQRTCPVRDDDTPQTLAARVFEEEKQAYPAAIALFQQRRLRVEGRRVMLMTSPAAAAGRADER